MAESEPTPFVVGVLILPPVVELMDVGAVDNFNMLDSKWLKFSPLPEDLKKLGQDIQFHYISPSGPGSAATLTAGASLSITDDLSSPAVQPGKLDVLYIPGALTFEPPTEEATKFIQGHANATCKMTGRPTDVISVCASVINVCQTGIMDGKTVTCPTDGLDMLKQKFPKVNWVDNTTFHDGRLWSAWSFQGLGQITKDYLHYQTDQFQRFPKPLVDFVTAL